MQKTRPFYTVLLTLLPRQFAFAVYSPSLPSNWRHRETVLHDVRNESNEMEAAWMGSTFSVLILCAFPSRVQAVVGLPWYDLPHNP
jgi:hypothetical protein